LLFKLAFIRKLLFSSHEEATPHASGTGEKKMNRLTPELARDYGADNAEDIRPVYLEALTLVERLHHRLLDIIRDEFDRRNREDINPVQALLLYNIGDSEVTASELRTRGYYLGSNVSYNVKKLVELGFLHYARSRLDRRAVRISLTPKGQEVHDIVARLYDRQAAAVEKIGGVSREAFRDMNAALDRLERFWVDQIRYRL
jgi:DNA-binding MarR family transcriptional regulator